jgi:multidrug resistance efflux pump
MLPVIVWLAAVIGVVFLYVHRHRTFTVIGVAMAPQQMLAAADNGIVRHIPVELFQTVRRGDLLAVVELGSPPENDYLKAVIEAKKVTALEELERLKADLTAAEKQFAYDFGLDADDQTLRYGRLALEVENSLLELLKIRTELELDKGLVSGLELEMNAARELYAKGAVHSYELQKAEIEYTALARKVAAAEILEQQASETFTASQQRLAQYTATEYQQTLIASLLEPYRKAVAVQEKLLGELFAPTSRMMLTSRFDGVVSAIFTSEGQGVQAGDIILTVSPPEAEYILAWLDPVSAGRVQLNQPVKITKHSVPQQVFRSEIVVIGPTVELLPEMLWFNANTPRWGRPVKILIPDETQLACNEIVGILGL